MTTPVLAEISDTTPVPRPSRRRRPAWIVLAALAGAAGLFVVLNVLGFAIFHAREGRSVPKFESLAAQPDRSLQGTVAYTTGNDRCVRIVAAAGQPARDVYCIGAWQPSKSAVEGKQMNEPQLVWRDEDRLEITMFRMQVGPANKGKPPVYTAEWQKLVDVRTGAVEDVPAAMLPSGPNLTTHPTVSPTGQRLAWSVNGPTGQARVTLTDSSGTRTVLSAHGPGEYGYNFYAVFWAPNWQWIAADDGRILIITPGSPPVTRVLVDGAGAWSDFPTFAATGENILSASK